MPPSSGTFFSNEPKNAITGSERMATIAMRRPQTLVDFAIRGFVSPGCNEGPKLATTVTIRKETRKGVS